MTSRELRIACPIPAPALNEAARLWWLHFGPPGCRRRPGPVLAGQGLVALDGAGRVLGVLGLRDAAGGFPARDGGGPLSRLFRPAPPTADLVIDGIAVAAPRQGTGRALVEAAPAEARRRGRAGLRAEVRLRDPVALAFWRGLGFVQVARGRYGWPWDGPVAVMRLAVEPSRSCPPRAPEA